MNDQELDDLITKKAKEKEQSLVIPIPNSKALSDVSVNDLQIKLDQNKTFEQQAEDLANAKAIAEAISDEATAKQLADRKAENLLNKANIEAKQTITDSIKAETEKQEAERQLYEAVLETFGIKKHLPEWLMKTLVIIFSPIYVLLTICIGVPCGIVKTMIDNIDNIICRYEKAEDTSKPKIKVTIWILFALLVCLAITLIVLKIIHII